MLVWVRFSNFITANFCQHQQKLSVGWPGSEETSEGLPTFCHIHGTFSHWYLWTGLISLPGEGATQLFNVKPLVAGGGGEQWGNSFSVANWRSCKQQWQSEATTGMAPSPRNV